MSDPLKESRTISIVVPVFRGELTLDKVVGEILEVGELRKTPEGREFQVIEVILVHDNGPDGSDAVLRRLSSIHPEVQVVWLARNCGQHAATLAGISASRGEWVVTLDEDGQHDPAFIPHLLDAALSQRCHLVYGTGKPPHGHLRRLGSEFAKFVYRRATAGAGPPAHFTSFRLVLGELARFVGATAGPSVYLDVALSWSISRTTSRPVDLRVEGRPAVSYSWRRLTQHFLRMVVSIGARPLGAILLAGILTGAAGVGFAILTVAQRVSGTVDVPGWSSLIATSLSGFGLVLISVGVVAGYLGVLITLVLGRPAYATVTDDTIVFR